MFSDSGRISVAFTTGFFAPTALAKTLLEPKIANAQPRELLIRHLLILVQKPFFEEVEKIKELLNLFFKD